MRAGAIIAAAGAAFIACSAMPAASQAQTSASQSSASQSPASQSVGGQSRLSTPALTGEAPRRSLRLNASGRWGVDFNVTPPARRGSEAAFGEVEAGAYYRVSPRLEVGASAGLTEPGRDPGRPADSDRRSEPRVRLESIFRF